MTRRMNTAPSSVDRCAAGPRRRARAATRARRSSGTSTIASTTASSAPVRGMSADARPPRKRFTASTMSDLPAPVSPVSTFMPGPSSISTSERIAKLVARRWRSIRVLPSSRWRTPQCSLSRITSKKLCVDDEHDRAARSASVSSTTSPGRNECAPLPVDGEHHAARVGAELEPDRRSSRAITSGRLVSACAQIGVSVIAAWPGHDDRPARRHVVGGGARWAWRRSGRRRGTTRRTGRRRTRRSRSGAPSRPGGAPHR